MDAKKLKVTGVLLLLAAFGTIVSGFYSCKGRLDSFELEAHLAGLADPASDAIRGAIQDIVRHLCVSFFVAISLTFTAARFVGLHDSKK